MQTRQTGGQWYRDTSPFSIPCLKLNDQGIFYERCHTHRQPHMKSINTL